MRGVDVILHSSTVLFFAGRSQLTGIIEQFEHNPCIRLLFIRCSTNLTILGFHKWLEHSNCVDSQYLQ